MFTAKRIPRQLPLLLLLWLLVVWLGFRNWLLSSTSQGDTPDRESARSHEAERRLRMLGDTITSEYDYNRLRERSRTTLIPIEVLVAWWQAYRKSGIDGLKPNWVEIDEGTFTVVMERRSWLGRLAECESLTKDSIEELAKQHGRDFQWMKRWLDRYRIGGLFALAPKSDSVQSGVSRKKNRSIPDLGALSEQALEEAIRRREMLGDLAHKTTLSTAEVRARAQEVGKSERTMWSYWSAYRDHGLSGLAPQQRSDIGKRHGMSERMEYIIKGIRLSNPDYPVRSVLKEARKRAHDLGEEEPSEWQVRAICDSIREAVKLIADRRDRTFRNKFRITYPIRFEKIVYQIDHTRADVLVRDIRDEKYRTQSGELKPLLSACLEANSRRLLAFRFGYDEANSFNVVAVLREAILVGGIPDEVWTDHAEEFKSDHVKVFLQELGIKLFLTPRAEVKGRGERAFRTFNTKIWAEVRGYAGSNTVERNPAVRAKYTISELAAIYRERVDKDYNNAIHSELGETPMEHWAQHCFAEPADPRLLDMLLKKPERRKIGKKGIEYNNRFYWHRELGRLVGEHVLIRSDPLYDNPDDIEVFHNGQWVCTAFAIDSARGAAVSPEEISAAQSGQRADIRREIDQARDALKEADHEIIASGRSSLSAESTPQKPSLTETKPSLRKKPKPDKRAKRKSDLIDRIPDDWGL